jgi:hypothetical protein
MTCRESAAELTRLLSQVEKAAAKTFDTRDIEPTLVSIVEILRNAPDCRELMAQKIIRFVRHEEPDAFLPLFGPGQRETVEFTMYALRWPEVAQCLQQLRDAYPNPSVNRMAAGCLLAFSDDWAARDLWASYADDPTQDSER